jgi:hypothetical protein
MNAGQPFHSVFNAPKTGQPKRLDYPARNAVRKHVRTEDCSWRELLRGQVGKATHVKDAGVFVVKSGPTVVESSVPVEGAPYKPKAERTRFRLYASPYLPS